MNDAARTRPGRVLGYVALWLVAAGLAVTVGIVAVTSVGASIRGRGPLGNEGIRTAELDEATGTPSVDPDAVAVRREVADDYGTMTVECRGTLAIGVGTDTVDGWRVVSFELGPDEDIDGIFSRGDASIEIEVFCNRGTPTVAEIERKTLPDPGPSPS